MIIDGFGIEHPTENDPITTEGLLHIANCDRCYGTFDGKVTAYAAAVAGSLEKAMAALAKAGDDGSR